jgi:hypothetical protein
MIRAFIYWTAHVPQQVECPHCLYVSLKKVLLSYLFQLAWSLDILRQDVCVLLQIAFLITNIIFLSCNLFKVITLKKTRKRCTAPTL